jgi:crossover junction endodeoxyribonuclease RusA
VSHAYILTVTGSEWLSANDRDNHWSRRHRLAAEWREATAWKAKQARIPVLQRVHVVAVILRKDARRFDPHNRSKTAKACIDGLVDAGVIPDDSWRYLDGPDMRTRHAPGTTTPTIELHISEATT